MEQKIINIRISDLVLWTENPRDPINPDSKDQDVVEMSIKDESGLWNLRALAKQMDGFYDFSEIPIVVYDGGKPVVYDGNRRMILAKIAKGLVSIKQNIQNLPSFPDEIPCNVCSKDVAYRSILRKHGSKGSWRPLERDKFIYKYCNGQKSEFMVIDEATNVISSNLKMDQRFVKDEVFNHDNLCKLGMKVDNGILLSKHDGDSLSEIINDLVEKIEQKIMSTRKSRGNVLDVLDDNTKQILKDDAGKDYSPVDARRKNINVKNGLHENPQHLTKRTVSSDIPLFGKKLILKSGDVNNLYRDICDLYEYYKGKRAQLSKSFIALIRMSLRLICETAAKEDGYADWNKYIDKYFDLAKKTLTKDEKTILSLQNVSQGSMPQLLNIGAHNYTSSKNIEQTLALSVILGSILQISHKR